ncbi:MAG: hypothetical protein ABII06_11625 [Pseudomonadota bacterium]
MAQPIRLGGFKVLNGITWIALVFNPEEENSPSRFFSDLAREKINLPYITCLRKGDAFGVNITVDASEAHHIVRIIEGVFGKSFTNHAGRAILSIFPHRRDPGITGSLFKALLRGGVEPDALASSPSALSIVLHEKNVAGASDALFEPFSFSAYRTPEDWKLAQKGKEDLYKEVVASYQEKRPKVYGLDCYENQEMVHVTLKDLPLGTLGSAFVEFARRGLHLPFLSTSPCRGKEQKGLAFCLAKPEQGSQTDIFREAVSDCMVESIAPVAVFSMNGPHFGDRYGIADELLSAFKRRGIGLLGLSCTIASVTGVVPSLQLDAAIEAIKACFDVPAVTKRGGSG